MNWELFWIATGSLFAGGALVWMVFSWFYDKRDKEHDEEKRRFYKTVYDTESRNETSIKFILERINEIERNVTKLDKTLALQAQSLDTMGDKFLTYSKEMRKIVADHTRQLTELGKVIMSRRG